MFKLLSALLEFIAFFGFGLWFLVYVLPYLL